MSYLDFVDKYGNLTEVEKTIREISKILGDVSFDCFVDKIKQLKENK